MNFRRQPFQFTSIDPAKRQAELQKRFGLPANDMYVDCMNSVGMTAGREPSSVSGSPRLQHRVPMSVSDFEPTKSESCEVDGHKPRVRIIPIQVEGIDDTPKRHRTLSGPAIVSKSDIEKELPYASSQTKSIPFQTNSDVRKHKEPRVCNIPIQIERDGENKSAVSNVNEVQQEPVKLKPERNGCAASKIQEKPYVTATLKKIENVMTRFKTYQEEVAKFTGTAKDKQYRYLDEMLTRCMLDLDNVDTFGLENLRQARKAAVKSVQAAIDLLDTKINASSPTADISMESECGTDSEMKESEVEAALNQKSSGVDATSVPCDLSREPTTDSAVIEADVEVNVSTVPVVSADQDPIVIEACDSNVETELNNQREEVEDVVMEERIEGSEIVIEEMGDGQEVTACNQSTDEMIEPIISEPPDSSELSSNECVIPNQDNSALIEQNLKVFSNVGDDSDISTDVRPDCDKTVTTFPAESPSNEKKL